MLIYSKIQAQQKTNNAKRTMKRKHCSIRFCHHFFFSLSSFVFIGYTNLFVHARPLRSCRMKTGVSRGV